MLELEALHPCGFIQPAHGAVQHQADHRQGSDRPQHDRGHGAFARRTRQGVIGFRTELPELQAVVAHEERQGSYVACFATHLDVQSQTALRTQQGRAGCHECHPTAATKAGLVGFPVLQQVGIEPEAGVDKEHPFIDARHLNRRWDRTQQVVDRIGWVCGYAVCAGKVVERTPWHHAHGAACGVCGLGHGIERAVAADGNDCRAGGNGFRRSPVRHAAQLGWAAEQQVPLPSAIPQRGFDDFALDPRGVAARRRVDDELER